MDRKFHLNFSNSRKRTLSREIVSPFLQVIESYIFRTSTIVLAASLPFERTDVSLKNSHREINFQNIFNSMCIVIRVRSIDQRQMHF